MNPVLSKLFIVVPPLEDPPPFVPPKISTRCQFLYPEGLPQKRYKVCNLIGDGGTAFVLRVQTPKGEHAMKIHHPSKLCAEISSREWEMIQLLTGVRHVLPVEDDFTLSHLYSTDANGKFRIDPNDGEKMHSHAFIMPLLPCPNACEMFLKSGEVTDLTSDEIMHIARQGFETLLDLKIRKIAHLDIKPENIAYDRQTREFLIFDFGSAQREPIEKGETLGTLSYWAPEQILGLNFGLEVDVWAFGATLYELYTGYPLVPVEKLKENPRQDKINYLHMLTQNVGPTGLRINGNCSEVQEPIVKYIRSIGERFPGRALWEAQIRHAGEQKKEPLEQAEALIEFLRPMLRYVNRITPEEFFKK